PAEALEEEEVEQGVEEEGGGGQQQGPGGLPRGGLAAGQEGEQLGSRGSEGSWSGGGRGSRTAAGAPGGVGLLHCPTAKAWSWARDSVRGSWPGLVALQLGLGRMEAEARAGEGGETLGVAGTGTAASCLVQSELGSQKTAEEAELAAAEALLLAMQEVNGGGKAGPGPHGAHGCGPPGGGRMLTRDGAAISVGDAATPACGTPPADKLAPPWRKQLVQQMESAVHHRAAQAAEERALAQAALPPPPPPQSPTEQRRALLLARLNATQPGSEGPGSAAPSTLPTHQQQGLVLLVNMASSSSSRSSSLCSNHSSPCSSGRQESRAAVRALEPVNPSWRGCS
ncbi:hypothetical protein QJQ45_018253, partial [Haematococcus lacustris]